MNCKNCKYFNIDGIGDTRLHKTFGFCEKLIIHEGEMWDASHKENIPGKNIDMVICTSEWFQSLMVSENFGCILFEQK